MLLYDRTVTSCSVPFVLLCFRYRDVSCSIRSKACSNLNLGLLDFGGSYTVILMEVRALPIQVTMQMLPVTQHDKTQSVCVCFVRTRVTLWCTRWRMWEPTTCTSPGRSPSTPSSPWERSCSPSPAWSSPTHRFAVTHTQCQAVTP